MTWQIQPFPMAISQAAKRLSENGNIIQTEKWQGDADAPPMREILNHTISCEIPSSMALLQDQVKPNLPWADNHFQERVGREPINPGVEFTNWPFYKNKPENDKFRKEKGGLFTHTYMERIWPRFANSKAIIKKPKRLSNRGIRYQYGDLDDVVSLLAREPLTRQAYLPIWFPEDTGVSHGGRVPCTLGYHFIRRDAWLHCVYPIRSCDFFRHFRDDIYFACLMVRWLIKETGWKNVIPGSLTMHMTSLHCFENEAPMLRQHFKENGNG